MPRLLPARLEAPDGWASGCFAITGRDVEAATSGRARATGGFRRDRGDIRSLGEEPDRVGIRGGRREREELAEQAHERRIELRAGVPSQLADGRLVADRPLVRPIAGHGVVGVGDGDDARTERDLVAAQPERIAVAREPLMVVEDERHGLAQGGGLLEDDLGDPGVLDDGPPLGAREGGRLREDLGRDGDLADVAQQGRDPDPVDLGLGQLERDGHARRDGHGHGRRPAAIAGQVRDDRRER